MGEGWSCGGSTGRAEEEGAAGAAGGGEAGAAGGEAEEGEAEACADAEIGSTVAATSPSRLALSASTLGLALFSASTTNWR